MLRVPRQTTTSPLAWRLATATTRGSGRGRLQKRCLGSIPVMGQNTMNKLPTSRMHRALFSAALLGIALRIFIPAGYMPASLSEGGPFVPCPGSMPISVSRVMAGHNHHAHGAGTAHSDHDNSHCPIGALFSAAAVPVAYDSAFPPPARLSISPFYVASDLSSHMKAYRSRAPPLAS